MSYGLGVDLGTTYTAVAVGSNGQTQVVTLGDESKAFPVPGGNRLLRGGDLLAQAGVGGPAQRPGLPAALRTGLAEPVPLALGGRPHQETHVLARALRSVLDVVTAVEGEAPERVVLTCPAVWGPVRRQQFSEVSRQVGLDPVTVVSEPEAATSFFAGTGRLAEGAVVVVYDLGAVTVDMTVVRVSESGTEILGLPEALEGVGGIDFDDIVLALADKNLDGAVSALDLKDPVAVTALAEIRRQCVRAKEALSRAETTTLVLPLPDGVTKVRLRRADFEAMIQAGLESTLAGLRRSMLSAGVTTADLAAVVLIGGSSRIPLVERILTAGLGLPMLVHEHPQHCVALGAATIAEGNSVRRRPKVISATPVKARPAPPLPPPSSPSQSPTPSLSPSLKASPAHPVPTAPQPLTRRAAVTAPARPPVRSQARLPVRLPIRLPAGLLSRPLNRRLMLAVVVVTVLIVNYLMFAPLFSGSNAGAAADLVGGVPGDAVPSGAVPGGAVPSASARTPAAAAVQRVVTRISKGIVSRKLAAAAPRAETGTGFLVGPAGLCLDVRDSQDFDGAPVQLYTCNGTPAQLWRAEKDGSLRVFDRCLETVDGRMMINNCNGQLRQQWQLVSGGIRNPTLKACVAVLGPPMDLADVGPLECRAGADQHWELAPA
jgi:molecular chaperone DnaK